LGAAEEKKLLAAATFAKAIKNKDKRKDFADKKITLDRLLKDENPNVAADDLPGDLRTFFNGLKNPDLKALADLNVKLVDGGLSETVAPNFTLGKF
jgi:hypothetical protein